MTSGSYAARELLARGAKRRIRALAARGWSVHAQSRAMGMSENNLWRIFGSRAITEDHAADISAMYERLWNQQPVPLNARQEASIRRVIDSARKKHWVPPMAWDDIDTDPAPPKPPRSEFDADIDEMAVDLAIHGEVVPLRPAERREAIRVLHAKKYSDGRIAATLGCAERTVWRIRGEIGLAAFPNEELEMGRAS